MSEKTSERYVLPAEGGDVGQDVLLDTEITVATLDSDQPGRLARVLRQLPAGDWLDLRDAFVHESRVVVVLPATDGTLARAVASGMPEHRRTALAEMLRPALRVLDEHGLSPRTLDPARVAMSRTGFPLLVPVEGRSVATDQEPRAVLALLGVVDPGPVEPDVGRGPGLPPAAAAGPGPHPRPTVPAPVRRVGLSPAETGDRGRTWAGRGAVIVLVALLAWGAAIALSQRSVTVEESAPGTDARPASASAVEDPVVSLAPAAPPAVPSTVPGLVEVLRADPSAAGASGPALLASLQAIASSTGSQQAFAAAGALELVRTGREDGSLVGPLVDRAAGLSGPLAQPADLAGLVALTSVDPAAFGPRTPKFLGRLQALQSAPAGDTVVVESTELLAIVRAGPGLGEFTPTFAALAEPVLVPLTAQP